jgi:hypothetical protein
VAMSSGIGEVAEAVGAGERRGARTHDGPAADHHDDDADPQVGQLVLHEARGDALVDDVGLLEEQLPGRDGGADDPDDQQRDGGELARTAGQVRYDEVVRHLRGARVRDQVDRDQQQRAEAEGDRDPFEAAEAAGERRRDDDERGQEHRHHFGNAEITGGEGDADELGHDRQCVENEQVDDRERAPELPEALQDQPGVADAGDRAEAQHHLLVDVEHRDEQQQRPQQLGAVVLAGLAVGGEGARVVVADHHDQAGADDGEQGLELAGQAAGVAVVVEADGAERTPDVADVHVVEDGGTRIRGGRGAGLSG